MHADSVFYIWSVKDSLGYVNDYSAAPKRAIVSLVPLPKVDILYSGATSLCHNDTMQLVVKITSAATDAFFGWAVDTANHSSFAAGSFAASPADHKVTYNPSAAEAGHNIKIYAKYQNTVCVGTYVYDTIPLYILPSPTKMAFNFAAQPIGSQNMCTDTLYEFKVKATDLGVLKNMQITLDDYKDSYITFKKVMVKRPYNAATWDTIQTFLPNPSGSEGGTYAIPGTLAQGDSMLIRATGAAECGFSDNVDIRFLFNASTYCNDALPSQTLYSKPFRTLQDTTTLNYFDFKNTKFLLKNKTTGVLTPDTAWYNKYSDTVTWHLEAIVRGVAQTDSAHEKIHLLIPNGLIPITGSYTPILNSLDASHVRATTTPSGIEFILKVYPGLTSGQVVKAEMKFTVAKADCYTYLLRSEVFFKDTVSCSGSSCTFNRQLGGTYPFFSVQRYEFISPVDSGTIINDLWNGTIRVKNTTPTYAGDTIHVDFFADINNNGILDPLVDTKMAARDIVTVGVPVVGVKIPIVVQNIPYVVGKQLLAITGGHFTCDTIIVPMVTLSGPDTVCQGDSTSIYTMPAGMQQYNWKAYTADAVTSATLIRSIPQGSPGYPDKFYEANTIRVTWRRKTGNVVTPQGKYYIKSSYTLPGNPPQDLNMVNFPVQVNPLPVITLSRPDTTVCSGDTVNIKRYFKETTGLASIVYYKKENNGSYTPIVNTKVAPTDTTIYLGLATAGTTGCQSDSIFFRLNVPKPQVVTLISNDTTICQQQPFKLQVKLEGVSPWDFSISGIAAPFHVTSSELVNGVYSTGVTPLINGLAVQFDTTLTYKGTTVGLYGCPGKFNDSVKVHVSVPTAKFTSSGNEECSAMPAGKKLEVALTGSSPWQVFYHQNDGGSNTYTDSVAMASSPDSINAVLSRTPSGDISFTLYKVEDKYKCTGPISNATYTITQISQAKVGFTAKADTSICSGDAVHFPIKVYNSYNNSVLQLVVNKYDATSTYLSTDTLLVSGWNPIDSIYTYTPTVPTQTTKYTIASVRYTVHSCTGVVIIKPTATATYKPFASADSIVIRDTSTCDGNFITLAAAAPNIIDSMFVWYYDKGLTQQIQTGGVLTGGPITSDTAFYISVSGKYFCFNKPDDGKKVTIRIDSLPRATLSHSDTICDGDLVGLEFVLTRGSKSPSWTVEYSENGVTHPMIVSLPNTDTITIIVSPTQDTDYAITQVIDGKGCVATYPLTP